MKTPGEISLKQQLSERLKQARLAQGYATAKEFALKYNLKVSTYGLHEAGTRAMSFDVIEHYCELLAINPNWLLTGEGADQRPLTRDVPIIEWEEILHFPHKIDLSAKRWTSTDTDFSPPSFAVTVKEDSMEPRYPVGTLLLVDLAQKPNHRDFALFALDKHTVCFKQLVEVKGDMFMRALNPNYPLEKITKGVKILGKVVQAKLVC